MQDDDGLSLPIGGVIEDVYITAPVSRGGDGITVYGSDGPVVILMRAVKNPLGEA